MARQDPQLKLRLTEEMKELITQAARESGRSTNAEIVARLEESVSLGERLQEEEAKTSFLARKVKEIESDREIVVNKYVRRVVDLSEELSYSVRVIKGLLVLMGKEYNFQIDDQAKIAMFEAAMFALGAPVDGINKFNVLIELKKIADRVFIGESHDDDSLSLVEATIGTRDDIKKKIAQSLYPIVSYLESEGWRLEAPEDWPVDDGRYNPFA